MSTSDRRQTPASARRVQLATSLPRSEGARNAKRETRNAKRETRNAKTPEDRSERHEKKGGTSTRNTKGYPKGEENGKKKIPNSKCKWDPM